MPQAINTKFGYQEDAYILSEARRGRLIKGRVERFLVRVGFNGNSAPEIFYAVTNHSVIAPPGGMYAEFQLATMEEAKAEAAEYHSARALLHANRSAEID